MSKITTEPQIEATPETTSTLDTFVREGARKMLQAALEHEVAEHLAKYHDRVDSSGRRIVVRNGTMPERSVLTGVGPLTISRPRVDDRGLAEGEGSVGDDGGAPEGGVDRGVPAVVEAEARRQEIHLPLGGWRVLPGAA